VQARATYPKSRFFTEGRLIGDREFNDYGWSLDEPSPFARPGVLIGGGDSPRPLSPKEQRAVEAVMKAWRAVVADLRNGRYEASGTHPRTGTRRTIAPAEWLGERLWVDVRAGVLFAKDRRRGPITLWTGITLQEVAAPRAEPASAPSARSTRERRSWEIEREMIRAILERAFPGKGPNYDGLGTTQHLLKPVLDGWKGECEARDKKHLIPNPPNREKIDRAIGRRD
jgi:hypothetical protein